MIPYPTLTFIPVDAPNGLPSFFVDNSAIEVITTCPKAADYKLRWKRQLVGGKPALRFGKHIHTAMAYRNKIIAAGEEFSFDKQAAMLMTEFINDPCPDEEWRNLDMATRVCQEYNNSLFVDDYSIFKLPDGSPFVERSFACYLGVAHGVNIIYMGRIDAAVVANEGIFILDYKTTSQLGERFWEDVAVSPQFRGYIWAFHESTGIEPLGYIIQPLTARQPTEKGKGKPVEIPVPRRFFTKEPPGQIDEWKQNTLAIMDSFLRQNEIEVFPRHRKHCVGKYGKCPYYHVCELPESSRAAALDSGMFEDVTWSPLEGPTTSI